MSGSDRFISFPTQQGGSVAVNVRRVVKVELSSRRFHGAYLWLDDGNIVSVASSMSDVLAALKDAGADSPAGSTP
jgi:hypothetical protein